MGCEIEVCAECTQKCLMIHGKREPSPIATSFFKVLVGDRFLEIMFLPPKFSRMVASLIDQQTYLEDSNGQRWRVKLSTVDGCLAFQQGWREFALDHFLKVGEFVVFNYIIGSHFAVQIYSESGCEKLNFLEKMSSSKGKRTRPRLSSDHLASDIRNSIPKEVPFDTIDWGSMNEQGSSSTVPSASDFDSNVKDVEKVPRATENTLHCKIRNERPQSVPTTDYAEVPYYMIDRDSGTKHGENQTSLFDLSHFEIGGSKSGADQLDKVSVTAGKETSCHCDGNPERPQTTLEDGTIHQDPLAEVGASRRASFDASDFEMTERKCNAEGIDKVPLPTEKDSGCHNPSGRLQTASLVEPCVNEKGNLEMYNQVVGQYPLPKERTCMYTDLVAGNNLVVTSQMEHTPLIGNSENVPQIITKMSGCCEYPVTLERKKHQSAKKPQVVKEELEEMIKQVHGKKPKIIKEEFEEEVNPSLKDKDKAYKTVKIESVESTELSSLNLVNFCCPVSTVTQSWLELPKDVESLFRKTKIKMERQIALLRDPAMRVWPVMYHERPGFKLLASGWKAFANANNIQQGDVCVFGIENESEGLFRVRIAKS